MLIKVVAVQAQMGRSLTLEEKLYIFRQRPDYVCLPEYWPIESDVPDLYRAALDGLNYTEKLAQLSDELDTILIGGSIVEAHKEELFNCTKVFDRGRAIGSYQKINPVPGEKQAGITPGHNYVVLDTGSIRIGLLLCSDVLHRHSYERLAELNPDIIFVPTISPYRPADSMTAKRNRDREYYQDGATIAGAYIVKACGVGEFMGKPLQGRSLIISPWEVLKRVNTNNESQVRILSATLDIDEIRDFRDRMKKKSRQFSQQLA